MSIPVSIDPLGTLGGGILPPSFPLREHVITGRVNGKTLGLGDGEPQPESWSQYTTRYNGVDLGYGFAAAVMIRGENEPGSALAFSARKSGEVIWQFDITISGMDIWTDVETSAIRVSNAAFAGVNMLSLQGYDELSKTLIPARKNGDPVISNLTYLAVPTYSHALIFDRELTAAEFAEVVAALRAIAK